MAGNISLTADRCVSLRKRDEWLRSFYACLLENFREAEGGVPGGASA